MVGGGARRQLVWSSLATRRPPAVVSRISQETVRFLNLPETKERYFNLGMEVIASSPEQFGTMLRNETDKWTKVIKAAGIREE